MTQLQIALDLGRQDYRPGETLAGAFQIVGPSLEKYTIELSVFWRTEGVGDEDLGVIFYEDWSADCKPFDFSAPRTFTVTLPRSPLTYDGTLIKIRWLARVRVRWPTAEEVVADEPFQLAPPQQVAV